MSEGEALWSAVQDDPSDSLALLAYADFLEEEDSLLPVMLVCRWMAIHKKWPMWQEGEWWGPWMWLGEGYEADSVVKWNLKHENAVLPARVFANIPHRLVRSMGFADYPTAGEAILALIGIIQETP